MAKEITLTPKQKKIVKHCAGRLNTEQIADMLGISRTTFFQILKRDEKVAALYKKSRANIIDQVSNILIDNALDGDTTSILFYLKTQAGWREAKEEKQTEEKPVPIKVTIVREDASKPKPTMEEDNVDKGK